MLLTTEQQTIPRKIKDIFYAHEMSKTVSKDKILVNYYFLLTQLMMI